jgi:hypothetical protein
MPLPNAHACSLDEKSEVEKVARRSLQGTDLPCFVRLTTTCTEPEVMRVSLSRPRRHRQDRRQWQWQIDWVL